MDINSAKALVSYEKLFLNLSKNWDDEWRAKFIEAIIQTLKPDDIKKTIILVLIKFKFYSPKRIHLVQDLMSEKFSCTEIMFLIDVYVKEKPTTTKICAYKLALADDLFDVEDLQVVRQLCNVIPYAIGGDFYEFVICVCNKADTSKACGDVLNAFMCHLSFSSLNISNFLFIKSTVLKSKSKYDLVKNFAQFLDRITCLSDEDKSELCSSEHVNKKGRLEEKPTVADTLFIASEDGGDNSSESSEEDGEDEEDEGDDVVEEEEEDGEDEEDGGDDVVEEEEDEEDSDA
jgi:hypothetical protein